MESLTQLLLLLLYLLLNFLGFSPNATTAESVAPVDDPSVVALSFAEAYLNGDITGATVFVCANPPPNMNVAYSFLNGAISTVGSPMDTSGLRAETLSIQGNMASVQVSGIVTSSQKPEGFGVALPNLLMVNENGWKVCGF
jgi:hypothetical protein